MPNTLSHNGPSPNTTVERDSQQAALVVPYAASQLRLPLTFTLDLMRSVEAEALALVLEAGAVSVADVRSWADQYVVSEPQPDGRILQLCTEENAANALSLLHELSEHSDIKTSTTLALRHLRRAWLEGSVSLRGAAGLLRRMANLGYSPNEEAERQMSWFAEDLTLIDVKEFAPELEAKIIGEFDAFLAKYSV
jgi:hypothetical protein